MANYYDAQDRDLSQSLVRWLLGFFGAITGFLLLPKTVKFFFRRFFFSIAGEVIAVVLAGLLAEKVADQLGKEEKS